MFFRKKGLAYPLNIGMKGLQLEKRQIFDENWRSFLILHKPDGKPFTLDLSFSLDGCIILLASCEDSNESKAKLIGDCLAKD